MKTIETMRFGKIEIDESLAVRFPEGLLGFPEQKEYVILEHKPGSPFMWMQSMTTPELAFVITNPFLVKKNYLEFLSKDDEALLEDFKDSETTVFTLVTIPKGEAEKTTINLMGPIIIDSSSRKARQIILANSGYSHRHPIVSG